MSLQQVEKDQIGLDIAKELFQTQYACSSLSLLSGGSANFLFRGILAQPLQDGRKTVIIKHFKEFISANRNFHLDISRCLFEEAMLKALDTFPSTTIDNLCLRTPHLYLFDGKINTQVLEDLSGTIDMTKVLKSPTALSVLPQSISTTIGRVLGTWLRSFHSWASEPAQADLQRVMVDNKPMRQIRYAVSYGAFTEIVRKFPEVWERNKTALEEVRDMATVEYAKTTEENAGEDWGIIHGDFWSGNVMIPNTPSLEKQQSKEINIFIIDWELAQFGRREYDLGQMIGDLYERKHFMEIESSLWLIQGFVVGYGALSDEMAFRIAIHAGVHLICWYIRRDPTAPFTEPPKQIQDAIRIGTNFIVKGWERDRTWFEGSDLACLFNRKC
ncbi:hypothetical protein B7494_g6422 [Chlorociboria aeruginascens]|nr:hypothetical protein B7494_g6422 [Chlorociboria aeruginascens]